MQLTITQPDDWHLHLRDGPVLKPILQHTEKQFSRAIVMPNLTTPVTTTERATAYRNRILDARSPNSSFQPLMTLYLTEQTTQQEINLAAESNFIKACKLYPAGATTNSDAGVKDIKKLYPIFSVMQEKNLVLCIHGEVIDSHVDIFDRESVYIIKTLSPLVKDFPELKIVLEHITTANAAHFIQNSPANIAATVTPHHLHYNRNNMLVGGIRPHYYCLPVLKRDSDRQELVRAATSGNSKFFLGTDSAPHSRSAKENACGCAGMFSAHAAIELYAEVFEAHNSLHKLESFASFHGADFYGLPRNTGTITLDKVPWRVPESYDFSDSEIIPVKANEDIQWKLV